MELHTLDAVPVHWSLEVLADASQTDLSDASRGEGSSFADELTKVRFDKNDIAIFLGEYLSEPKPNVFFDSPARPLTPARFSQSASKRGVALSRKSRMLYCGKHIFINGEAFVAGRADKTALITLANERQLSGTAFAQASADVQEALCMWYEDGWLVLL